MKKLKKIKTKKVKRWSDKKYVKALEAVQGAAEDIIWHSTSSKLSAKFAALEKYVLRAQTEWNRREAHEAKTAF